MEIKALKDSCVLILQEGEQAIALCRCGASQNKPYCDGSHKDVGFEAESNTILPLWKAVLKKECCDSVTIVSEEEDCCNGCCA